jgi:hypothetical protein
MNKVCLYARSGQNELYGKIGLKLERSGTEVCYIVQNIEEAKNITSYKCLGNIYILTDYIEKNWENIDLLNSIDLTQIENEYGIESLWSIFYTDRFLNKYPHKDALVFIKLHILFFKEIILFEKINVYINENIAIFSSYIFYLIGRIEGVLYLGISCPRNFVDKKIYFTNNEHAKNYLLDQYLTENTFSTLEIINAKDFISSMRGKSISPAYMKFTGIKPEFKFVFIMDFFKYLVSFFRKRFRNRYDYEHYQENKSIIYSVLNYYKYFFQKKYFHRPDSSDKFYLFPLHFQPEATTLINAQNYEKQLCAIDLIAKKIPINSILYVKEHYAFLGHREGDFYKKLKKYSNVRLIDPWSNPHELIQRSIGVITLTGTVGWESMFLNKPVFMLGNMFYESFKYINKVDNINDLSRLLKEVDHALYNSNKYETELLHYAASYLKSLKDGNYILSDSSNLLSQVNVENITANILHEINHK